MLTGGGERTLPSHSPGLPTREPAREDTCVRHTRFGPAAATAGPRVVIGTAGLLGALLACGVLTGCSEEPTDQGGALPPGATTTEYLPGLAADVHEPQLTSTSAPGSVPVVLLVPGGGWETADRTGLTPLAEDLADAGMLVVNTTYRASRDGATFPEPVQDVICAAGFAVAQAEQRGLAGGPLVVVGHSAGGHLAALTALSSKSLAERSDAGEPVDCPYDPPEVDGLVGLAGVYDASAAVPVINQLFGASAAAEPDMWRAGDPIRVAGDEGVPDDLQVLLLHGDADEVVPLAQSQAFDRALTEAGIPVELQVVPGADHNTLYDVRVAAEPIRDWIQGSADFQ